MTWYKPHTWFKQKPKEIEAEKALPEFVYAKVELNHRHAGLAAFSQSFSFEHAIKITGTTLEKAEARLTGRVIDYEKLTDDEFKKLQVEPIEMNLLHFLEVLK